MSPVRGVAMVILWCFKKKNTLLAYVAHDSYPIDEELGSSFAISYTFFG